MTNTDTLLSLLNAISKQNTPHLKKVPALTHYTGTTPKKSSLQVNPTTSKGSTHDGTGHGVLGTLKNLGHDIEDTVTGIPGGVIQTIHHPVATAEAVGADYKKRYGPLLGYLNGGGDIGKFASQVQAHPLAPLLDLASVATGGGALAAKVGQSGRVAELAGRAGAETGGSEAAMAALKKAAPVRTKLFQATKARTRMIGAEKSAPFKEIRVAQSRNPVKRLRQNLGLNLQESKLLPTNTPLIGLASRAKKAANLQRQVEASAIRRPARMVDEAAKHLTKVGKGENTAASKAMAIAAQGLIDGVAPKDYARLVRNTRGTQKEIAVSLKSGRTVTQHHAETDSITRPHLDAHANELYQAARQNMQEEAIRAGRSIDPVHLQHGFRSPLIHSREVEAIVKLQKAHENAATSAMNQLVDARQLKPDVASQQAVLHVNLVRAVRGQAPRSYEETARAFEAAGLPTPSYNPDVLTVGDALKKSDMLKESKGTLYTRGTKVYSPMNIVMRHELASKATDAKSAHMLMLSAARKIKPGEKLPKGYVWIRDSIPSTLDMRKDLNRTQMEDGPPLREDFYKTLESEQRPKGGYALPEHVHNDIARGRQAMSNTRQSAAGKGLQVWKYSVLFRPAFVVHNLVSNQLMFHLKNGWNFPAMTRAESALKTGVFDEHHGSEGITFADDARMRGKSKTGKAVSKTLNGFYAAVGWHEHKLRQLTMYETARKMPEVQREIRRLKGGRYNPAQHGGRTIFHEAYNAAVKKNVHVRDLVTRNMDDTLGNYRYYTQQERALKNLSPFYGWERHSVRNMVRMMEDNPATMAMLTQIGMFGHDKFLKDFGAGMPDFVKSYVEDSYINTLAKDLGIGDKVSMYDFNSLNPWTTAIQVGQAATGDKQAMTGLAGPVVTAPIEELTGKSVLTGAPVKKMHTNNPIESMIERVFQATPPATTYENLTSTQNEDKKMLPASDKQTVAQQFGLDFRNLDKGIARKMEAEKHVLRDKYGNPITKKKKAN